MKYLAFALTFFALSFAWASDSKHGASVSLRYIMPSFDGYGSYANSDDKNSLGFSVGYSFQWLINESWSFRSGAELAKVSLEASGDTGGGLNLDYLILEVPALGQYNFTDNFGVFSGLKLIYTASDSCRSELNWVCENSLDTFSFVAGTQIQIHDGGYINFYLDTNLFKIGEYEESIVGGPSTGGYDIKYSSIATSYVYFF